MMVSVMIKRGEETLVSWLSRDARFDINMATKSLPWGILGEFRRGVIRDLYINVFSCKYM